MSGAIDLAEKLASFADHWSPRTITQFNNRDVMVVKVKGEFVWHSHADTDDFFLVLKGNLAIQLRDRTISLGPGQMYVVPKGVEHRPVAKEEVHLLLIEPTGTPNAGDRGTAVPRQSPEIFLMLPGRSSKSATSMRTEAGRGASPKLSVERCTIVPLCIDDETKSPMRGEEGDAVTALVRIDAAFADAGDPAGLHLLPEHR